MAAVTVSFDGTRVDAADALGSGWTDAGGKSANLEPDVVYQRSTGVDGAVSEKVTTTSRNGVRYTESTPRDFTTNQTVVILKCAITNPGAIGTTAATGAHIDIVDSNAATTTYYIATNTTYPKTGGWLIIPIDPSAWLTYADAVSAVGSPDFAPGSVDYYQWTSEFTASSKVENVVMDAVDIIDTGTGLTVTGGDGGDADATMQDFADFDEGTLGNSYGLVTTKEGVFYVVCTLSFGETGAGSPELPVSFTDSNQVVVFPDGRVVGGFFGTKWNCDSAQQVHSVTNFVFTSVGTETDFDTRADHAVNGTNGTATFTDTTWNVFRLWTASAAATFTTNKFIGGETLTQNAATLTECDFLDGTQGAGEEYVTADAPNLISGCVFNFSGGHALRITVPGTYAFDNTFNGAFGADGTSTAAVLNDSGGYVQLNVTTGDTPTVTNAPGSPTNTTLVSVSVSVTFEAVDKDDQPIENVRVTAYAVDDDEEIINTLTNASGIASTTYTGSLPRDIYYRYRKSSTGATKYVGLSGFAEIVAGSGASVKRSMTVDTTADPDI